MVMCGIVIGILHVSRSDVLLKLKHTCTCTSMYVLLYICTMLREQKTVDVSGYAKLIFQ